MHGQMRPQEQAGGDGRVRRGRRRRARRDDRDRGRHRRPQRHRDARRGRRALRHLPAAPAARPDRPRRSTSRVCLLFGPKDSRRLQALAEHRDGFQLAEIDLELRGEGEMLGVRQSGMQAFRFARLPEDVELLERARRWAREILDADPELRGPEHALLEDAIVRAYGPWTRSPPRAQRGRQLVREASGTAALGRRPSPGGLCSLAVRRGSRFTHPPWVPSADARSVIDARRCTIDRDRRGAPSEPFTGAVRRSADRLRRYRSASIGDGRRGPRGACR